MLLFLLFALALAGAETPNQYEILEHVKLNVRAQLAMYANYTCVQTIERTYYSERHACLPNEPRGKLHAYMRDRLRLDVAVSRGREIYSFHGESKFTSSNINSVIPNGPRTSGQFTGFLQNIFTMPGVLFTFKGSTHIDGAPAYQFDYVVQLLRSTFVMEGQNYRSIVPFHGSFAVNADTFELVRLNVIADDIPLGTGMCTAETDLEYQIVSISGRQSLLPASYVMKIANAQDVYTVNSNKYTECREFRGESTLHFTVIDPGTSVAAHHVVDEVLPAGLILQATVEGQIDDKDSYEGDPIDATLVQPVAVPGSKTVLPKGAKLHGVISKLEQHSQGLEYWLLAIKFEHLETAGDTYLLNASPLPPNYNNSGSRFSSDRVLNAEAAEAARHGWWFMDGAHFKLSKHFTRFWQTQPQTPTAGE